MRYLGRNVVVGVVCVFHLLPLASQLGPDASIDAFGLVPAVIAVLVVAAVAGRLPRWLSWTVLACSWVALPAAAVTLLLVARTPGVLGAGLTTEQLGSLVSFFRLAAVVLLLFSVLYAIVLVRHWREARPAAAA